MRKWVQLHDNVQCGAVKRMKQSQNKDYALTNQSPVLCGRITELVLIQQAAFIQKIIKINESIQGINSDYKMIGLQYMTQQKWPRYTEPTLSSFCRIHMPCHMHTHI